MKIKILALNALIALGCVGLLNAAADAAKTLPPLILKGASETQTASFNSNRTTVDLYNRYQFIARGIDGGGNIEGMIKRLREYHNEDVRFWKEAAAKSFVEPQKPEKTGKGKQAKQAFEQAMKSYERRRSAAMKRYENQQAVATAYLTWLSDGVLPWIETLKK